MYKEKPVTLICVQPCVKYYAWQIEVMLTNFRSLRINEEFEIHTLWAYGKHEPDWEEKVALIQTVEKEFIDVAQFHYYEDTREYPVTYISSLRPNILKQHLLQHPELSNTCIFYHDCDIIFSKFPLFLHNYQRRDNNWYVSNTVSYIGYDYIKSKGDDVLNKMCDIVGIFPDEVRLRQNQSGGAQYILKNVDYTFFHQVEKHSERLFKEITELNNRKKALDPSYHELQIWCADMWAILWNAWKRGYNTNVIEEMNFTWATDDIENFYKNSIYHNAGVVNGSQGLFYKGMFIDTLPYEFDGSSLDQTKANYKYFEIIQSINKNSCLYGTI